MVVVQIERLFLIPSLCFFDKSLVIVTSVTGSLPSKSNIELISLNFPILPFSRFFYCFFYGYSLCFSFFFLPFTLFRALKLWQRSSFERLRSSRRVSEITVNSAGAKEPCTNWSRGHHDSSHLFGSRVPQAFAVVYKNWKIMCPTCGWIRWQRWQYWRGCYARGRLGAYQGSTLPKRVGMGVKAPMIDCWERIWQDGRGGVGRGGPCLPPLQACGPLPPVIGEEGDGVDIDVKANVVVAENRRRVSMDWGAPGEEAGRGDEPIAVKERESPQSWRLKMLQPALEMGLTMPSGAALLVGACAWAISAFLGG